MGDWTSSISLEWDVYDVLHHLYELSQNHAAFYFEFLLITWKYHFGRSIQYNVKAKASMIEAQWSNITTGHVEILYTIILTHKLWIFMC